MATLVIDTSNLPLVAVVGESVAIERGEDVRHHAETLAPMVASVLAKAGIDRPDEIVVGTGPAAFTGLRAGIVTARTLASAWNVPLIGISSLDALAASVLGEGESGLMVLDARRKEVYAELATKTGDDVEVAWGPVVDSPEKIETGHRAFGPGVAVYPDVFNGEGAEIDPVAMAKLGAARRESGASIATDPLYLRRPDIHGA